VAQNVVVPKSHHAESLSSQPVISPLINERFVMLSTIGFYDKTHAEMHEVHHVGTNGLLAPEFRSSQPMGTQMPP
jgi:hypothetical protein